MKQVSLESLEKIRKKLCCYTGDPCDCKTIEGRDTGENSGCVEVRLAIYELRASREVVKAAMQLLKALKPAMLDFEYPAGGEVVDLYKALRSYAAVVPEADTRPPATKVPSNGMSTRGTVG